MIMDQDTFESKLKKAEDLLSIADQPDYWYGYKKGLQRQYHGESVIPTDDHIRWISYFDDPFTMEKGKGYIDGFFS